MPYFISTNKLDFEVADWPYDQDYKQFRIGTIEGLWGVTPVSYDILAITNKEPGNGHLQDVFDWFEMSCKRDNKNLRILEVWNKKFMNHLIEKRGFKSIHQLEAVYKPYTEM